MDDLNKFNNEELFELYEKVEEEIKKLDSSVIVEVEEDKEEEENDNS